MMLSAIGILLCLAGFVFPEKGWRITDELTVYFRPDFFVPEDKDTLEKLDVDSLLEIYTVEIDSMMLKADTIPQWIASIKKTQDVLKIQYPANDLSILTKFFESMELVSRYPVRILHYGDSQIEGDRMTGFIRNEFQKQFGGTGCGLVPIFETFPTFAVNQSDSGNWKRYANFFSKNKNPLHQRFGVMGNYSRFTPAVTDSLLDSLHTTKAWVRFTPNKKGYRRAGKYNKIRLLYGYNRRPVVVRVYVDDRLIAEDTLPASQEPGSKIWSLADYPTDLKLEFEGEDSPDIYAISLESPSGVHVDNIGMRGSSGTFFKRLDRSVLESHFSELEPSLILLQYGGNTVPGIHSKKKAAEYGNWFAAQIRYLKKLNPHASFIVIGPSDMAEEVDGKLQTRKYLEDVRDALRIAAFDSGAAFWDLYEVMGGKNSMIAWVEADPPLAAPDYTHFAPRGARKLSKFFYQSLMEDYQTWKNKVP